MKFKFNSVVFASDRLKEVREFYEEKLGLPTGTYSKNGQTVQDFSDDYVNYHIGGGIISFAREHEEKGEIILEVSNFDEFRAKIERAGIPVVRGNKSYFIIMDPEGRELIFQPMNE